MAALHKARHDYPDARHHCWAYQLGSPQQPSSVAFNDDGEPSGTAGKPILNVLNHKDIGDITVVVIRYFGGIKLGAGGLVRAYSAATQQALEQLPTTARVFREELALRCDFAHEAELRRQLELTEGEVVASHYSDSVELVVRIPCSNRVTLDAFIHSNAYVELSPAASDS